MDSSTSPPLFRRTEKGNFYATIGEGHCTVFRGKFGRWSYFLFDEPAGQWFDTSDEAISSAIVKARRSSIPECLKFFGLAPPVDRDTLMAKYREAAKATHPDHGGSCELFKKVQAAFESALLLIRGVA